MTIEFHCPHCDKLLKTPDDKAGVRANCPGCGQTVTVPDPMHETAPADPSFAPVPVAAGAAPPLSSSEHFEESEIVEAGQPDDTKNCPMCGASIKKAARRCRFCGETLVRTGAGERVPTKIEAGEVLGHAWEIYKKQLGLLIGAVVVIYGITIVTSFAGSFAQQLVMATFVGPAGRGGNPFVMAFGVIGLTLLATAFNLAVGAYLQSGFHVLLLRVARGENAEIADMFSATRFFWRFFWGTLLFQIMIGIGFVLLIIPGIILVLMFWPIYYVIVDRDTGVIESLRLAQELTSGNYMAVFVLFLASLGIGLLGILGCGVGLLFAIPLVELLFAVAYCGMNGQAPVQRS